MIDLFCYICNSVIEIDERWDGWIVPTTSSHSVAHTCKNFSKGSGCFKEQDKYCYSIVLENKVIINGSIEYDYDNLEDYFTLIDIDYYNNGFWNTFVVLKKTGIMNEKELADKLLKISSNIDMYLLFQ